MDNNVPERSMVCTVPESCGNLILDLKNCINS